MATNIIKKIPSNETIALTYTCVNKDVYKITQHKTSGLFTIYKIVENGFDRLGKGNNPTKLEQKYIK